MDVDSSSDVCENHLPPLVPVLKINHFGLRLPRSFSPLPRTARQPRPLRSGPLLEQAVAGFITRLAALGLIHIPGLGRQWPL